MKRWYVLQVYSGYEEAVRKDLLSSISKSGVVDSFGDVMVPSAQARSLLQGAAEDEDQQLFPGYVLIEAELTQEVMRLVLATPKVVRFLGGLNPASLSKKEVERILSQVRGEVALPTEKVEFVVGAEVDIQEGPFAGFVGLVEDVDDESERLTVMVSIFGRLTPVELSFNQVKR